MISDKVLDKCLQYMERIDLHASGVQGEIMYIKELLEQQRTPNSVRKESSKRFKKMWKNGSLNTGSGKQ